MPTTLILNNIPDAVYERLKALTELHRRSMSSEAIVRPKAVLVPTQLSPAERLACARELRAALKPAKFVARDIDALKLEGRP
jgi:antitoxin FitA